MLDTALAIEIELDVGFLGEGLLQFVQIFPAIPRSSPPVINDGVPGDLPHQCPRVFDLSPPAKRLQRSKKHFLLEVGIVCSVDCPYSSLQFVQNFGTALFQFLSDLFHLCSGCSVMMQTRLIGQSDAIEVLHSKILAAARTSSSVLIQGETGTGKELVARSIHERCDRHRHRFVPIDCGALPEDLVESELFGYRRGAFTTAVSDKRGLFEEADHGTLFLDEIANTSKRFQVKFLRVLQEKQVRRLGDLIDRPINVRIIAATNCDLRSLTRSGDFREDLLYRLNVFAIEVPPLRKRLSDIPLLAGYIVESLNAESGLERALSPDALEKLKAYHYPGNVRELQNVIESGYYMSETDMIEPGAITLPADRLVSNLPSLLPKSSLTTSGSLSPGPTPTG